MCVYTWLPMLFICIQIYKLIWKHIYLHMKYCHSYVIQVTNNIVTERHESRNLIYSYTVLTTTGI